MLSVVIRESWRSGSADLSTLFKLLLFKGEHFLPPKPLSLLLPSGLCCCGSHVWSVEANVAHGGIFCSSQCSTDRMACMHPVRRSTAAGAASVWWTGTRTSLNAGVSRIAGPATCLSVDLMAGSMKITASCIEPHACRGRKSTLSTARTVSSEVGHCWK